MSDKPASLSFDNIRYIAHELKNPIGATKGFIDLAENAGELNPMQHQFLERALQSLERMERLVGMLLEAAGIEAGKPLRMVDVDLVSVVKNELHQLEPFAQQHKVTLHLDVPARAGWVSADLEAMGHIVANLLVNAIKYNQPGGSVWVSLRGEGDSVRLEVRDNGRGIHPDAQPHIFERFFRAAAIGGKIEGTGLGLYIVKSLVDMHNGMITFESAPGVGTTFHLVLARSTENEIVPGKA
ncbi:MAG: HAMP domain-containing sensor histidine kinase [Chloroflexota bacterium]|nr:HAMP domain-containing sensor histidine kinase [Chloroflexota bacterium]